MTDIDDYIHARPLGVRKIITIQFSQKCHYNTVLLLNVGMFERMVKVGWEMGFLQKLYSGKLLYLLYLTNV